MEGSGRRTPAIVSPSVFSKVICSGAGPLSLIESDLVSPISIVLIFGSYPSSGNKLSLSWLMVISENTLLLC